MTGGAKSSRGVVGKNETGCRYNCQGGSILYAYIFSVKMFRENDCILIQAYTEKIIISTALGYIF